MFIFSEIWDPIIFTFLFCATFIFLGVIVELYNQQKVKRERLEDGDTSDLRESELEEYENKKDMEYLEEIINDQHTDMDSFEQFVNSVDTKVINGRLKCGYTPLNLSIKNSNLDKVKILHMYGANIDGQDRFGDTALIVSIQLYDNGDIFNWLHSCGTNPNIFNNNGYTALLFAMIHNEPCMVKRLLEAGANKNAVTKHGINCESALTLSKSEKIRELLYGHR